MSETDQQGDLFQYPDRPGFVKDSPTSKAAAESIDAGTLRQVVFAHIQACLNGATCDEVEVALTMRHQTVSARIRELVMNGRIRDTGRERKTRSNRNARIYVIV